MKILITGADGQLGTMLRRTASKDDEVRATDLPELDITDPAKIAQMVEEFNPDWVINAAAYTAVDLAESNAGLAKLLNADSVGYLVEACRKQNVRLCHVSTDFVFSGDASIPYAADAEPAPKSVYGETKFLGERALGEADLLVRTSWVYSEVGKNFVKTMLNLFAREGKIRVVADQIGSPTYARNLAVAIWALVRNRSNGIFHYSDSGVASWYDFAVAISEEAAAVGIIADLADIEPIPTSAYPTPATRPHYSVLDCSKTVAATGNIPMHWRSALRDMLKEYKSDE